MDASADLYKEDDNRLVARFKNGDISAFNRLVIKYQKKLYSVVYKIILDHDETNDVLQDVFIKVYNSISSFREESGFYTWIYRITVNMTLNRIKKLKSAKLTRIEEINVPTADEKNISETTDNNSKLQFLRYAVSRLPEQQRIVFCLRQYEGLSYQEISVITGKSIGGLKANYFHAFAKISEIMKNKFNENEQHK
jgi:RNA polymerase sigma-70 factor (ECF subfamily)